MFVDDVSSIYHLAETLIHVQVLPGFVVAPLFFQGKIELGVVSSTLVVVLESCDEQLGFSKITGCLAARVIIQSVVNFVLTFLVLQVSVSLVLSCSR